ncbi:MAG: EAL domain-containing protein, partial [Chitinophagaceae bacterium]|nr:EAL domain-containing protein [Rubrivivax sp.]
RPAEVRCRRRDGSQFDVRASARRIAFEGRPATMVTLLDISELKGALRAAEWNASMLARTEALCRAGSFEVELASGQVRMSAGLLVLLQQGTGCHPTTSLDALEWVPADEQNYVAGIWRNASPGEAFEFQHRVLMPGGERRVVLHRGQLGADGNGVALVQDVTGQVEAEQRIQDLAHHHEVTGLPNRAWLLDQIDAAMHIARWDMRCFAVLTIDMPRIAEVRASMGFGAGDAMCMALAARLRQACDGSERVAHLGDTEFAVLLESAAGDTLDEHVLQTRSAALQQRLEAPVRLGVTDIHARCLIGIARFPGPAGTADRMLECAQTARLDVVGGAGVAFFRAESGTRAVRAMAIESALRQALEQREFQLHYQPQVDVASGAICGAEALLRWHSAQLGSVSPAEFIPVAEQSGLIGAISDWVLRQACSQIAAWRQEGLPPVRVSVNMTAAQLQIPDFAQYLQAVLQGTGASASCLGVELTESMVMTDVDAVSATLRALKATGVQVSLDDFGTGFSSLSSLSRLPMDVVKVDRSFVREVTADAQDVSVTRAIIQMTHSLQMRALAEGVETEGQLSVLVAAGCDEIQGWWFSPAVPADEFAAMLRADKRLPERYVRRPLGQRQRTLLLVDDEQNILAALRRLLRRDGYRILTANSAAEGLQCLACEEVDVILSDQRMPGMTGVEFLHRAKDLYPNTLRLVLSGYTELQSIIDAVNEGAIYKFLTKPWDDERLRGHIADAFRQKELADENRRLVAKVDRANVDLATLNDKLARTLLQQRGQVDLLAASRSNLREVFEELPLAVLGIDGQGVLVFANREAERVLPRSCERFGASLVGLLPAVLLSPRDELATGCERVDFAEGRFEVRTRDLPGGAAPRGRVLVFTPLPLPISLPSPQLAAEGS